MPDDKDTPPPAATPETSSAKLAKQLKKNAQKKVEIIENVGGSVTYSHSPAPEAESFTYSFRGNEDEVEEEIGQLAVDHVAPFPVDTRLKYHGGRRLFAGWEGASVLEPGTCVTISATHGPYSHYLVEIPGGEYPFVIGVRDAGEWSVVE